MDDVVVSSPEGCGAVVVVAALLPLGSYRQRYSTTPPAVRPPHGTMHASGPVGTGVPQSGKPEGPSCPSQTPADITAPIASAKNRARGPFRKLPALTKP